MSVKHGRLLDCIHEIYTLHQQTFPDVNPGGYWPWFLKHRGELARNVMDEGPVGAHKRVQLFGLVANSELNGAEGWVTRKNPQPSTGRLAVNIDFPLGAALEPQADQGA